MCLPNCGTLAIEKFAAPSGEVFSGENRTGQRRDCSPTSRWDAHRGTHVIAKDTTIQKTVGTCRLTTARG